MERIPKKDTNQKKRINRKTNIDKYLFKYNRHFIKWRDKNKTSDSITS